MAGRNVPWTLGSPLTRTQNAGQLHREKWLDPESAVEILGYRLDIVRTHGPVAQAVPAGTIPDRKPRIVVSGTLTLFQSPLLTARAIRFRRFRQTVRAGARHATEWAPYQGND